MVQKLLQDRVAGKVEIEEGDLELYYQANKDRFVEKDDQGNVVRELPFSEVYDQVSQEFSRRKFQDAYQGLIEKMIIAEGVKFYENRVQ
jgi:hypothetical protein